SGEASNRASAGDNTTSPGPGTVDRPGGTGDVGPVARTYQPLMSALRYSVLPNVRSSGATPWTTWELDSMPASRADRLDTMCPTEAATNRTAAAIPMPIVPITRRPQEVRPPPTASRTPRTRSCGHP